MLYKKWRKGLQYISITIGICLIILIFMGKLPSIIAEASSIDLGPVTSKDVIYQIITDRFYDGDISNNMPEGFDTSLYDGSGMDLKLYQGGDWAGIIKKIPYLKDMGVTALWISAPYENRDDAIIDYQSDGNYDTWTSFHGYHVRNYFATNKHFGTLKEFKDLRDALQSQGIKLIIDFVTNHTSRAINPTDNNTPEDGKLYEPDKLPNGEYALDENGEPYDYNGDGVVENLVADPNNDLLGWFHGLGDRGNDNTRFGYRYKDLGSLADFSQENSMVVEHLEKAALYWANMGINGIRHDATLHLSPSFAKGLKDAVDSNNTITHFGEYFIGRPDPKYDDYVYYPTATGIQNLDFEFYRTTTSVFGTFSTPMSDFADMIEYTSKDYEYENQTVTFIDNHDVSRFGYYQRNEKVYNAAMAVLLTSRGIPNIYYGTEQYIMPEDGSDIAGRVFMQTDTNFDTSTNAYKITKKLSDLRQENNALAYGQTNVLYSDDDIMVFERKFYDDIVVVAVNRQPDREITIPSTNTSLTDGSYSDNLSGVLYGQDIYVQSRKLPSLTLKGGEVSVWSYNSKQTSVPQIGNVVSTMGRQGNKVYIYGSGLSGNITVKFDDVVAPVSYSDNGMIITEVPANAIPGYNHIIVTKDDAVSNTFTYNVLSGDQNQIIFHVKADTNMGENIYIVGNIPELGNWDPDYCTEAMLNPNYPEWFLPVSVPVDTRIEFKFIKKDSLGNIIWESGVDRRIVSASGSVETVDSPLYEWRD